MQFVDGKVWQVVAFELQMYFVSLPGNRAGLKRSVPKQALLTSVDVHTNQQGSGSAGRKADDAEAHKCLKLYAEEGEAWLLERLPASKGPAPGPSAPAAQASGPVTQPRAPAAQPRAPATQARALPAQPCAPAAQPGAQPGAPAPASTAKNLAPLAGESVLQPFDNTCSPASLLDSQLTEAHKRAFGCSKYDALLRVDGLLRFDPHVFHTPRRLCTAIWSSCSPDSD